MSPVVRFLALLMGVLGVLNIAWALFPRLQDGLEILLRFSPFFNVNLGRLFHLAFGISLAIVAGGLRRRKRYALWVAAVIWGMAAVYSLLRGGWLQVLLACAGLVGLWLARGSFIAPSASAAVKNGLRVWLAVFGTVLLLTGVGLRFFPMVGDRVDGSSPLVRTLSMFFLFYDPIHSLADRDADMFLPVFSTVVYAAAMVAGIYLLLMLELPLPPPPVTAEDRSRAQSIVQAHGRSSQAHLTLLSDKHYLFTPGGSLVAYGVSGRVAMTLGDPIGPAEDIPQAISAFCEHCTHHDWLPAFCLTGGDHLSQYRQAGFEVLCMGHEGIIELSEFSLRGNQVKTLRKRFNRLSEKGYQVEVHDPPISSEIVRQLREISDEWLGRAAAAEKRFFLAWFDDDYVSGERIAIVRRPDGKICAFANLVPEYQLNEISIDLMRRRQQVESGTMDFLFVSLLLWARDQGYATFNLGLSPLYGVGERPGRPLLERAIRYFYQHGNFYDFKGLNGFKIKFRPAWMPQYLLFPGLLTLGWVGLAMARVNAGENESLWEYFRSRPKREIREDTDDKPVLLPETPAE